MDETKVPSPSKAHDDAVVEAYHPGEYIAAVRHRLEIELELTKATAAEEARLAAESEAQLLAKRVRDLEAERVAAMAALKAEAEAREIMERKLRESELGLSLMESVLEGGFLRQRDRPRLSSNLYCALSLSIILL